MSTWRLLAVTFLAVSFSHSAAEEAPPDVRAPHSWRVVITDSPTPPDPAEATDIPRHAREAGVRWYVRGLSIEGTATPEEWSVGVVGLDSAWELWWDGQRIGSNGVVGDSRETESPGRWLGVVTLPAGVTTPGVHQLSLRASAAHGDARWRAPELVLSTTSEFRNLQARQRTFSLLAGGVFLTATVFSLALFLGGGRQRPYLLFGLHLVTCLASIAFSSTDVLVRISAPTYRSLLPIATAMVPVGGVLLIAFFASTFAVPRRRWHYWLAIPVSTLPFLLAGTFGVIFAVIAYVMGLLVWAALRRRPGSLAAMVGVTFMAMGTLAIRVQLPHAEYWNVAGLILFIFSIAISTSRQLRVQNQEHEADRLRSARLEADLLKRGIQPHFLMNTLLSVMSWIRRDPETACRLIQSLADEFRLMLRISSSTSIPLESEIELCRAHLRLMGYRNDAQYEFVVGDLPSGIQVPPLVLHTLVENGLTHSLRNDERGTFTLHCEQSPEGVRIALRNDGSHLTHGNGREGIEEGLGFRYVRSRLEESFPGGWHLAFGLKDGQWETVIRLPGPSGPLLERVPAESTG